MKKLKITLVQDSQTLKDPVQQFMNSEKLNPGSDVSPVPATMHGPDCWIYKGKVFRVEGAGHTSEAELMLLIKHRVLRDAKKIQKIKREVEAFDKPPSVRPSSARRGRIPESVRIFVWRRDGGQCIQCGTKERLEFDHIIPVVEGGGSTERNLQLLCEACNRKKGKSI